MLMFIVVDIMMNWKVSRRLYILDDNFSVKSEGIRGDLGGLFLGFNLRADNEKYRKLDK